MGFLCRVDIDSAGRLANAIRDGKKWRRIRSGATFHTVGDEDFLEQLCLEGIGSRPLRSLAGHPVDWIGRGQKRPHVRYPPNSEFASQDVEHDRDGAHEWVQYNLENIAARFDDVGAVEVPLLDGQRADVVWKRRKYCWEVDLTPRGKLVQLDRIKQRYDSGYRTISIVDAKRRNDTHQRLPRVLIRNLRATARRPEQFRFGFLALFVSNQFQFDSRGWTRAESFKVSEFLRALANDELAYGEIPGPVLHRGRLLTGQVGWAHHDEWRLAFEERQRVINEENAQRQRAEAAAERRRKAELESQKAASARRQIAIWKSERQNLIEQLRVLTALEVRSGGSRSAFMACVANSPPDWPLVSEKALLAAVAKLSWWRLLFDWSGVCTNEVSELRMAAESRLEAALRQVEERLNAPHSSQAD